MIYRLFRHENIFIITLAAFFILFKFVVNDHLYFSLKTVPGHDMTTGAGLFATNMHSLRLTGEPAYWSPAAPNGFAQYYQSFLSPNAPVPSSPVFILWTWLNSPINRIGIVIPEFYQYLIIVYLILPFLTIFFFGKLIQLLFHNRYVTVILSLIYMFSSIGIWQKSWFYFQEPFAVFFLLWAVLKLVYSPSVPSLGILAVALINQCITVNYWTVNNLWFYGIFLGIFFLTHAALCLRAAKKIVSLFRAKLFPVIMVSIPVLCIIFLWLAVTNSILNEQSSNYRRLQQSATGYTSEQLPAFMPDTLGFFRDLANPVPEIAQHTNPGSNPIHSTRYLGMILIPIILFIPFIVWPKKYTWLLITALGLTIIISDRTLGILLWKSTPYMSRNVRIFEYYTLYVQLALLLIAGALLRQIMAADFRVTFPVKIRSVIIIAGSIVIQLICTLPMWTVPDVVVTQFIRYELYMIFLQVLLSVSLIGISNRPSRKIFYGILICVLLVDYTVYYRAANSLDHTFTEKKYLAYPGFRGLNQSIRDRLAKSWSKPEFGDFSGNIIANMPIITYTWPDNSRYMEHTFLAELESAPDWFYLETTYGKPFSLAADIIRFDGHSSASSNIAQFPVPLQRGGIFLHAPLPEWASYTGQPRADTDINLPGVNYEWKYWSYNYHRIQLDIPESGFLLIRTLSDPLWQYALDGNEISAARANYAAAAIPITAGSHLLEMDYRPFVRRVYLPLSYLTMFVLAGLAFIWFRYRKSPTA